MRAPLFAALFVTFCFSIDYAYGKRWLRIESVNDMIAEDGVSPFYAQVSLKRRWPDKTVYYAFDPVECDFNETQKEMVLSAMEIISNATCIEFKERLDEEPGYISIQNLVYPDKCNSAVGYTGKKQVMNIAVWCLQRPYSIAHEFIHALGFHHEQTRYDRDMYVELLWDNISKAKQKNYNKYPRTFAYPKYEYNLLSMMHYSVGSSTSNRPAMVLNTVFNVTTEASEVGQRTYLSNTDIWRITSAYRCYSTNGEVRAMNHGLTEGQLHVADVTFY